MSQPIVRIVRQTSFSAAHRNFNPKLSAEENRKLYGSFYRDEGFGHNFLLDAYFEGPIDPLTGMIVNLVDIDRWLKAVTENLDHKDLNTLAPFAGVSPTSERIVSYCFTSLQDEMRKAGSGARLVRVTLHEGDRLQIDCYA